MRLAPLLAVCLIGRPAAAQAPITEEARKHFNAGVAYLQDPDGARYAEAYQEFLTAYAASPSWKILGNLGIAAMKLERDGEAVDAYAKYLQEGGNDIDPAEREQITRDMNTLKTGLVGLTLETAPAGAVIIDERIPPTGNPVVNRYGPLTGPTKIGIKSGKHRLHTELDGYDPTVWELDAQPGGEQSHTFEIKKTPPPPPPGGGGSYNGAPVDHPTSGLRIASYAAFGVGVLGLAGGTYFALTAKSKQDELNTLCGGSPSQCPLDADSPDGTKATQLNNDSGSNKTLGIVGFAVGGVGIAAGVTLFILSSGSSSHASLSAPHVAAAKPAPRIIPWVGYNSAGVVGQF
ncbi:MAG TPA: hypothetical protein VNG33_10340 [Polyangiaceae bacterium]|nr:hypothetical protein [Polyangiaceae bacterium]